MLLSEMIEWTAVRSSPGGQVRYGTLSGEYYRQYLPYGIEVPNLHPPKKITLLVYTFALKQPVEASDIGSTNPRSGSL